MLPSTAATTSALRRMAHRELDGEGNVTIVSLLAERTYDRGGPDSLVVEDALDKARMLAAGRHAQMHADKAEVPNRELRPHKPN